MPKATLEFNLPEDNCEYRITSRAMDWALAAEDLDNALREIVKYHSGEHPAEAVDAYDRCRTMLREKLAERGVSLEDLE